MDEIEGDVNMEESELDTNVHDEVGEARCRLSSSEALDGEDINSVDEVEGEEVRAAARTSDVHGDKGKKLKEKIQADNSEVITRDQDRLF